MMTTEETRDRVPVESLVKGLYVDLELSWNEHPFMFSRFKIKSDNDLRAIRKLGMTEITVIPERSDVGAVDETPRETPADQKMALDELWQNKNAHIEQANHFRDKRQRVAKRYKQQAQRVKNIIGEMKSQPANAIHNVDEVVEDLASTFDGQPDLVTNLVNLGSGTHTACNHAINVTMLSLMLGNAEGLSKDELQHLGMGALLHDMGKIEISSSITMKKAPLSHAEGKVLERHTLLGRKLAECVRDLPEATLEIIELHHEFLDGSGYPHGLPATKLSKLVRIVTVTNIYDSLCNPPDPGNAVTPKTAMAMMYSKYRDKLDRKLVERFIQTLGVYPPGTVVRLNDESIGLVITADPGALLQPEVLLYNVDIPRDQALIVDLKDQDELSIVDVLRPGDYPERIYEYLGIQERLGYFIENQTG